MMPRPIVLIAMALALAAEARADLPSPVRRDLDIRLCFENLDEYPEYDFFLRYTLTRGNPAGGPGRFTRVESGSLTRLERTGGRSTDVHLVAVRRSQPIQIPEELQNKRGITLGEKLPGTLQSTALQGDAAGNRLTGGFDNCEITYRVRMKGESLRAEFIESKNPGSNLALAIVGITVSALVLFVGFVFTRERKKPSPPPVTNPQLNEHP